MTYNWICNAFFHLFRSDYIFGKASLSPEVSVMTGKAESIVRKDKLGLYFCSHEFPPTLLIFLLDSGKMLCLRSAKPAGNANGK